MRQRSEEQKHTISNMAVEAKRLENEIDRNLETSKQLSVMHEELVENLLRFSEQDEKIRQLLDNRQDVLQFVERSRKEIQECNDKINQLKQQGGAATDRSLQTP